MARIEADGSFIIWDFACAVVEGKETCQSTLTHHGLTGPSQVHQDSLV